MASTSRTPSLPAVSTANPKISSQRLRGSSSDSRSPLACIGAPDPDVAETRRTRSMARAHYLFRLSLPAIGRAPEYPVLGPRNGGARVPEFRGNAAVTGIFQHADAFAIANFPTDFTSELKVVALVVN